MEEILKNIETVVYKAGQIILSAERRPEMVESKEGHANFVTIYDKKVQDFLQKELLMIIPHAKFIGEENHVKDEISSGFAFIVDPIDGTTNFIKDYKASAISVGLLKDGIQELGLVYNPYLDEMFTAIKGHGAYLNGKQIKVSNKPLNSGIVLFGTAPYYEELSQESFKMAYDYFKKAMDIRRSGSAAIDLCSIACGRAELYFEMRLSPWDYAAGSLIVKEAGGMVTTIEGKELEFDKPCSLLATNKIAGA